MLGECIGKAFHPSAGMCSVFQSLDSTKHVVLVSPSGARFVMRRENVLWRRAQHPGPTPRPPVPVASDGILVSQPTLFDSDWVG